MSVVLAPGVTAGLHGYPVPGRSAGMGVAHRTEHGITALYASKYGVQGGYLAALLDDALKAARILTVIAYYILGIAQIVRGSLTLYWAVKRSQFHSEVRRGLNERDNVDAQAAFIWDVYRAHMSVNQKALDADLREFKLKYDSKGVAAKQAAILENYRSELNSWVDYFSEIGYRIQSWALGLFGRKYRGENLVQKRHDQIREEIKHIQRQMLSLTKRRASAEEMHATLDSFKRARLEDGAQRANLKALSYLTSPEFAAELYHNRNAINMSSESHRAKVLRSYELTERNYHTTKVANIVEGLAYIMIGIVSVAVVATIKASWVPIALGALGSVIYARTVVKGTEIVRYILGAERRETFAEKVHNHFNTFRVEHIKNKEYLDAIYGD